MRLSREARRRLEREKSRKNNRVNKKQVVSILLLTTLMSTYSGNAATLDDLRELMGSERKDSIYTPEQQRKIIYEYTMIENNNRLAKLLNASNPVDINKEIKEQRTRIINEIEKQRNKLVSSFSTGVTVDEVLAEKVALENLLFSESTLREERDMITMKEIKNTLVDEYKRVIEINKEVKRYKEFGIVGNYLYSPVRNSFEITSPFGYRIHPKSGGYEKHNGIDLRAPLGTEIQTVWEGVVTSVYESESGGKTVEVTHDEGLKTRYLHLSEILVEKGQKLKQYDLVGKSGNTGESTGPHLHFEVMLDGDYVNPVYFFGEKGAKALENLIMGSEDPLYQAMAEIIPRIKTKTKNKSATELVELTEVFYGEEFEPPIDSIKVILKEGHKMPEPNDEIN